MGSLFQVFLALWVVLHGHMTLHVTSGAVQFVDLYGNERRADGAAGCFGGQPRVWISSTAPLETLVHELAHAYDCLDNGQMDGSPTLRPESRPAWVSNYCWESDAEWYACSVVHYRSLMPHLLWSDGGNASHHATPDRGNARSSPRDAPLREAAPVTRERSFAQ